MAGQQQHYYKIVLLGDVGVGKTSLFNRIKSDRFVQASTTVGQGTDQHTYQATIGEDSVSVSYFIKNDRLSSVSNNQMCDHTLPYGVTEIRLRNLIFKFTYNVWAWLMVEYKVSL